MFTYTKDKAPITILSVSQIKLSYDSLVHYTEFLLTLNCSNAIKGQLVHRYMSRNVRLILFYCNIFNFQEITFL